MIKQQYTKVMKWEQYKKSLIRFFSMNVCNINNVHCITYLKTNVGKHLVFLASSCLQKRITYSIFTSYQSYIHCNNNGQYNYAISVVIYILIYVYRYAYT